MNKPHHIDMKTLTDLVVDVDNPEIRRGGFDAVVGRYADPDSVMYTAQQRALIVGEGIRPELQKAAVWVDGFLFGIRFAQLRDSRDHGDTVQREQELFVQYLIDASDAAEHEDFDITGIVEDLEIRYGTTYFNNLTSAQFWAVANEHRRKNT